MIGWLNRQSLARCLLVLALGAVWACPALAFPVLSMTVTSHKESPKGLKPGAGQAAKPGDETFPLTVTLGRDYLVVEAAGTRTIYDFAGQRIRRIDLEAKTYTDASLYSNIGFRVLEFQNRLVLGAALQAAKLPGNPMDPVLMEHLFSLSNPKGPGTVDQHHAGGVTSFSAHQQLLMSVSDKTQELPAGYQAEYWRFLRYYVGGHPAIYSALAAVSGVPVNMTVVLADMSTETRTMTLDGIRSEPDSPYSLAGFRLTQPDEAPYNTLIALEPDGPAELAARAEATTRARDAAFADGNSLDALLANLAIMIMTDGTATTGAWVTDHRDALQADEASRTLSAHLNPRDRASAQAAVEALSELHKRPGSAIYMLDVFEGNTLLSLRDGKGGAEHLLAALAVNPYLVGAWKDLGGFYYQSFQAEKAWACWDTARRLNPRHSMLAPIGDLEGRLRHDFPAFF